MRLHGVCRGARWWVGAALFATLLAACGGKTGIIIEITRDMDTTPSRIERLLVFVGVDVAAVADDPAGLYKDAEPHQDVAVPSARDLASDPFRLLLRRGDLGEQEMTVVVLGIAEGGHVALGTVGHPIVFVAGRTLQWPVLLRGRRGDRVELSDGGCLIWTTDGGRVVIRSRSDKDCDGDLVTVDCNDSDPTIGPSRPEICANGIDDDCDGQIDETEDADGDLVNNCLDCDDRDPNRTPGKKEICDGIDNDCNFICDDGELDGDKDRYTVCQRKILYGGVCSDPDPFLTDCNDSDPTVYPGAPEVCNGIDNNCNLLCDETFDADGDGYTTCGSYTGKLQGNVLIEPCINSNDLVDCHPHDPTSHPNAPERCDGIDNNCDEDFYSLTAPCFVRTAENACVPGLRQCGDAMGLAWITPCQPDPQGPGEGVVAPFALCNAFDACADHPDPLQCAIQREVATVHTCTVSWLADVKIVCPGARAPLPNDVGNTSCQWRIIGGSAHPKYDARLAGGGATSPQRRIDACDAEFAVLEALDWPAVTDEFLLYQNVRGINRRMFRISVNPANSPVSTCDPLTALVCPTLAQ